MMTVADIADIAGHHGLAIYGGFHPSTKDGAPENCQSLVMLGPALNFWDLFQTSPEYQGGTPHPVDRWSTRVVSEIAVLLDAAPLFPFGGPPFQPFISWALRTGQTWSSPVNLLVHAETGMFVSFRGALAFDRAIDLALKKTAKPCDSCAGQPCRTTCPVGALTPAGYDVETCKSFLSTETGSDCMARGCAVRRACPISLGAQRKDAQSALHMKAFL